MTLRLHTQARNSAGERVRIALNLKGVAYEYVPVPALANEAYRALNPQQLMPAMEVDGQVLTQSLAILEYLEEAYPEPSILPADPIARARSRAFAMAICAELHAVTVKRVRRRLPAGQVDGWYGHWTATTFTALEQMLAERAVVYPFCFADVPTLRILCWCRRWRMPGALTVIFRPTRCCAGLMHVVRRWRRFKRRDLSGRLTIASSLP